MGMKRGWERRLPGLGAPEVLTGERKAFGNEGRPNHIPTPESSSKLAVISPTSSFLTPNLD